MAADCCAGFYSDTQVNILFRRGGHRRASCSAKWDKAGVPIVRNPVVHLV